MRLTVQPTIGANVMLFDQTLTAFADIPVPVVQSVIFSEGQFAFQGGTGIRRAVVTFPAVAGTRFAIDNLTYTIVPEPGTMLGGVLLAGFCGCVRARTRP